MEIESKVDRLSGWIRDRVEEAGMKGAVLGLSGGIDSAVVAALCKKALGDRVLGVMMPCHSRAEDIQDAYLVARTLGLKTETVVLDRVFDLLYEKLTGGLPPLGRLDLPAANIKPRLRMTTLYFYANRLGYMVVGTGNRSELEVGYFTKYGDGGVDILPLANTVKSEVREMARYLGIPREIIDRPPSAGLWAGQTDESEMGLTYEELDHYITTGEGTPQTIERIKRMNRASHHKRSLPPSPDF